MSTTSRAPAVLTNGQAIPIETIPSLTPDDFHHMILDGVAAGQRVVALFGASAPDGAGTPLYAILADDLNNRLHAGRMRADDGEFPSVTPQCPQVHLFEREIAEQFGLIPVGHPWLKPVRYHRSSTTRDAWHRPPEAPIPPAVCDFFRVEGDEVHEVAVGPVHAGIIEPGHFRFQCHGERVFHLEIALGYQHRGIERALSAGPGPLSVHYAETLAGDTTIAHTTSYCQAFEALAGCRKSARAQGIRAIALELERLANHIGDLGALANDVGYLPTSSFCGRIRGDFLNMTALLCGNRFGRSLIRPGGVAFDLADARAEDLLKRLDDGARDAANAINLLWDTPSVMARFEDTGPVSKTLASELGLVGPAARASGIARDVRHDQPSGMFRFAQIPIATYESGDVFSRAYVRWLEVQSSIAFIRQQVRALAAGEPLVPCGTPAPHCLAVSLNEAWRGEVCHVAITGDEGRFERYKVVDPSFHNWTGLAMALRNQEISDFPLCNKSFNLSYCGHDL